MTFVNCIMYSIIILFVHILMALIIKSFSNLRFDESCGILFSIEILVIFMSFILYICTNS